MTARLQQPQCASIQPTNLPTAGRLLSRPSTHALQAGEEVAGRLQQLAEEADRLDARLCKYLVRPAFK